MRMLKVIIVVALSFVATAIHGQTSREECQTWCNENLSACHEIKSQALLNVNHFGNNSCGSVFRKIEGNISRQDQLTRSLEEMEAAAADPQWAAKQGSELPFGRALREELIGRQALLSGSFTVAAKFFDDAAMNYESGVESLTDFSGERGQYYVLRAVLGLARCGKLVSALVAAQQLTPADADRSYITAEIQFQMGNRHISAIQYEKWVHAGCRSSEFPLISYDEFGPQLIGKRNADAERPQCERLPSELRGRLEDLKQQFGHPNNLPNANYPPLFLGR